MGQKYSWYFNRFTFGEVSPLLGSRSDLSKFQAGFQKCENFLPLVQGPLKKRGGTRFVAKTNNGANPVILMPFIFSESTTYMLEFGNKYMRVYEGFGRVPLADLVTPWAQGYLFQNGVGRLRIVQIADVMYCVCPGVPPQKITRHTPTDWRIVAMSGWDGKPAGEAIALWRERLCIAHGQTINISQSGAFENFTLREEHTTADDPLEIHAYAEQNDRIRWLVASDSLLVGTSGGEFIVGPNTSVDPFGPLNVKIMPETSYGSAAVQALRVGATVMFLQRSGRKLREFVYDYTGDNYRAADLTVAAEHITQGGLTQMAWQSEELETLWATRPDGQLVGFTYSPDQEMTAWHRHIIGGGGKVVSVAVLPAEQGGHDVVWLAVVRTLPGGRTECWLEVLEPGHTLGALQKDAFFVDGGVTVESASPITTVSGLSHLAGATVDVVADSAFLPAKTVSSGGTITLDFPAKTIHVGFNFKAVAVTNTVDMQSPEGTIATRKKRYTQIAARFIESLGGKIGHGEDEASLQALLFRATGSNMDTPTELQTTTLEVNWGGGTKADASIYFVHDEPSPFLLASIVGEIEIDTLNR